MLRGVALILIMFSFLRPAGVFAQVEAKTDSTKLKARADSIKSAELKNKLEFTAKRFNPRKALLFSAILPGAGQVYNKKYWKLPFVYGGIIGFAAVVNFYNNNYSIYKNQLFAVVNYPDQKLGQVVTLDNLLAGSPKQLATSNFTKQQLEDLANSNRRNRDYFVIITGFIYILQMVDAHVDAHLKEFKINPTLQVKLEPRFEQNYFAGNNAGMALVFKF
jgi:hypothetical protein